MIKAVLFDHGGTLDSDGTPWKEQFYPIYLKHGINVPQEKFDRAFYDSDDNLPLSHNLKDLSLSETVFLQVGDVLKNLKINNPDAHSLIAGEFVENNRRFFKRNIPILKELSQNYKLGVVSNNYGNLNSMLKSEGFDFFEVIADSTAVGFEKPDPEIFNYALTRLAVLPENAVMVGDNLRRDIKGALSLGMYAAYLTNDNAAAAEPGEKTILINRLDQLPLKLKKLEGLYA